MSPVPPSTASALRSSLALVLAFAWLAFVVPAFVGVLVPLPLDLLLLLVLLELLLVPLPPEPGETTGRGASGSEGIGGEGIWPRNRGLLQFPAVRRSGADPYMCPIELAISCERLGGN